MIAESEIDNLVATARKRGRDVSVTDVENFLLAKTILQRDPSHKAANDTVRDFLEFMQTGKPITSFAGFTL